MNNNYLLGAKLLAALFFITSFISVHGQEISDFENLLLDDESYWNGSEGTGGFQSGGAYFYNSYNADWGVWSGFIYSNSTDVTTGDYTNDYSAITGSGVNNSSNYAIAFNNPGIKLDEAMSVNGFYVTNSTYAYLVMQNGNAFSKKFGGTTGEDPDWFMFTAYGYLNGERIEDSVNFYLADFRFEDPSQDYIINSWEWVDLSSLGILDSLSFGFGSSDVGDWGINTPTYFAMDNFNQSTITSYKTIQNVSARLYPNPASSQLYFDLGTFEGLAHIIISNSNGIELIDADMNLSIQNHISIDKLEPGMYFITLETENGKTVQPFYKK